MSSGPITDRRPSLRSGYHEVVCTSATLAALQSRLASPSTASRPQIRISSTFFHHLSSDEVLSPRAFADRVRGSDVVKREGERLKGRGQEWEVERYEEGMQVGTLVEVS